MIDEIKLGPGKLQLLSNSLKPSLYGWIILRLFDRSKGYLIFAKKDLYYPLSSKPMSGASYNACLKPLLRGIESCSKTLEVNLSLNSLLRSRTNLLWKSIEADIRFSILLTYFYC